MLPETLQRIASLGLNLDILKEREEYIDSLRPEEIAELGDVALGQLSAGGIGDEIDVESKSLERITYGFGSNGKGKEDFCRGLKAKLDRWLRQFELDYGLPVSTDPIGKDETDKTIRDLPDPVGFLTGDEQVYTGIVYLPVPSTGYNNNRETILEPRPNLVRVARTALAVKGLVPYSLVDLEGLLPVATNGV